MSSSNEEVIKKIKKQLDSFITKENDPVSLFSDDVINVAYQRLSANLTDMIQLEDDPMVINELLQGFLTTTKMIEEKDLSKQQLLLKMFDQLTKYEQSRYR